MTTIYYEVKKIQYKKGTKMIKGWMEKQVDRKFLGRKNLIY